MCDKQIQLRNIDPDDIDDVLMKIQETFGIKPGKDAPVHLNNFGELCDAVLLKIDLRHSDGCTSQQAFYKLRKAVLETKNIDKKLLTLSCKLEDVFPRKHRRKAIKQFERKLGFSIKILEPKRVVSLSLAICFLSALVLIFFNWKYGVALFYFFVIYNKLANYFAKEFKVFTLGDAAKYIARENYMKARRDPHTINNIEVVSMIKKIFMERLDLPETALTMEATFN